MSQDSIQEAIKHAGNMTKLALALGVTRAAVWQWAQAGARVPELQAIKIEQLYGIKVEDLRPDLDWSWYQKKHARRLYNRS